MNPSEQKRFDRLYQRHLRALKLHGFSKSTMDDKVKWTALKCHDIAKALKKEDSG